MGEDIGPAGRPEDWTSDSLQCTHIHLATTSESAETITLRPRYLYAIFGETEKVFGFKGLSIDITLAAASLHTLLEVSYTQRIPSDLDVDNEDVIGTLLEYLPPDTYTSRTDWVNATHGLNESFKPSGTLMHEYTRDDIQYHIYRVSLTDRTFVNDFERMQIFSLIYIEGASLVDSADERFDVWTIYSLLNNQFAFAGYSTCYRYNFFDKVKHSLESIRYRISQFVILPHVQSRGHGGCLYDSIYNYCRSEQTIIELTVEDPSEAFDDLRDRRDFARLTQMHVFDEGICSIPPDKGWQNEMQRQHKIAPRQFARLLEMALLAREDSDNMQDKQALRRMIKSRLFKKNQYVLAELDPLERIEKLAETYQGQVEDYQRLLSNLLVSNGVTRKLDMMNDQSNKRTRHN